MPRPQTEPRAMTPWERIRLAVMAPEGATDEWVAGAVEAHAQALAERTTELNAAKKRIEGMRSIAPGATR